MLGWIQESVKVSWEKKNMLKRTLRNEFRNQQNTLDECRWDVTSSLDEGSKISLVFFAQK